MLLAGMESNNRVGLLLKLTKIKSEGVTAAIYDNLCRGITAESAAALNEITPGQLSRALEIM